MFFVLTRPSDFSTYTPNTGFFNMLLKLKHIICVVCFMVVINSRADTENSDVRIVTEHLPPYQISKNNTLIGGTVALEVQKLFEIVSPTSAIEVMPWARTYKLALERPNTVIFSLVRTPEREDKFIWIGKVAQVTTEIIALKSSDLEPVKTLSELKNTRIGVKRQDAISTFLSEKGFEYGKELVEIVYTVSTMRMLENRRVEAIPANRQIIEYYCQKAGCVLSDFKTIYVIKELSEEFYLAVSLGTDKSFVEQLKAEFSQLDFPVQ